VILEVDETVLWRGQMAWKANWLKIVIGILTIPILIGFILLLLVYLRVLKCKQDSSPQKASTFTFS
jgi:hypothetical protein